MHYKEIQSKSILRKQKKVDSWFISSYGMNLYRGCVHNCSYCDGRSEKYFVEGSFTKEIEVKINAIELLQKEMNPAKKRKKPAGGFVVVGGGICDSYQVAEKKYGLTRRALETAHIFKKPVHMLTKSTLVERDLDLLKEINYQKRAILSMSFSSVDEKISAQFEPAVPSPQKRLDTLAKFKEAGISCGMFLMPALPYLTDSEEMLEASFEKALQIGLDYIIFSGLTLKPGRQQDIYYNTLSAYYPGMVDDYQKIYTGNKWGNASSKYYEELQKRFYKVAKKYPIPLRIPPAIYNDIVLENERVIIILEHLDYLQKLRGHSSPYGYAAYQIAQLKEPLNHLQENLTSIKGVGNWTAKLIREILITKRCKFYEQILLNGL